jgi:hypothetical protein
VAGDRHQNGPGVAPWHRFRMSGGFWGQWWSWFLQYPRRKI